MSGSGKYDTGARIPKRNVFQRIASWWRMENALINAHCEAVCRQRDEDYQQYLIWRGILK